MNFPLTKISTFFMQCYYFLVFHTITRFTIYISGLGNNKCCLAHLVFPIKSLKFITPAFFRTFCHLIAISVVHSNLKNSSRVKQMENLWAWNKTAIDWRSRTFKNHVLKVAQSKWKNCFKNWFKRLQKCFDLYEEYFEKQ